MAAHIASPHNRRAPKKGLGRMPLVAQEDIGAVLERFHKWAGQQQKPVRELTYEEAVARSRHRVQVENKPPRPEPVKAAVSPAPTVPPPPIPFPLVKDPPPFEAPAKPSRPSPVQTATSGKKATYGKQPVAATEADSEATKRKSAKALSKAKVRPGKKSVPKAKTPAEPEAVPAPQETFEQVLATQMQSPIVEPPPHAAPDAVSPSTSLAVTLTGITSIESLPEDKPTVHLTMRLTPDEREALRQRASELGVTPSDYARQCALQMDLLRTELKNRQQSQQASVAPPLTQEGSQSAEPGAALSFKRRGASRHPGKNPWLQRLKNFFFPRPAKGQRFAARA